jgi:hypothetical protein
MKRVTLVLSLIGLSACGGGSSTPAPPPPTSFDVAAALADVATSGLSINMTVSGTVNDNAVTGTATFTEAPAVAATFNGMAALSQTVTITGTLNAGGQQVPYASTGVDYTTPAHEALGLSTAAEYDVAQAPFSYPSSVVVGSTAVVGTFSRYTDSTMSVSLGTIDASYAVKADPTNSNAVIVEVIEQYFDTAHINVQNGQTNFIVTASGGVSLQSVSVQLIQPNTANLTFTAQ